MTAEPTGKKNHYVMDAENVAEMGRLMRLDAEVTECMGGLFPQHPDLAGVQHALDVACGPGAWASELAYSYQDMQVTGIDISEIMIRYAQEQARVQRLDNVHFQVMDATQPLAFPEGSFDLVNARFLCGFMSTTAWPRTVREFVRVTRPGGIIRLTEIDSLCLSNSLALEQLNHLFARSFFVTGRSFSPYAQAQHIGLTPMLSTFLTEAGCQDIHQQPYAIDFSAGARAHLSHYENFKVGFKLFQPFLVQAGVTTQEELDQLYDQMLADMLSEEFRGFLYFLSVWGIRP
jgi:ubiquinone/menaquinone biosynthesis C-methylase UbiE